jgi:hypothetical protein
MSEKKYSIKLTRAELNHIQTIMEEVSESGSYYGNREQYYKRHNWILYLLENVEE